MTIFDKLKESTLAQAAEFMVKMVKLCETAADILKEPVTKLLQEMLESEIEEGKHIKCDGCGKVIKNPYKAKMREFFVDCNFDFGMALPENSKRKTKVYLCEDCYHGLNTIGKSNVHVMKVENGILQLEKELEEEKIKIVKNEAVRDFSENFNFVWFRNNVYDADKAIGSSNFPDINSLDVTVPSLYLEWIASFLTERFKAEVKGREL